jgi:methylenetetrahydrofolate dehydrogenase (NADP+) / methenyltetrahydrofolate cyclohydrolase
MTFKMVEILDGKKVSKKILQRLELQLRYSEYKPKLSIILCGEDPASVLYTNMKKKRGLSIGLKAEIYKFDEKITEEDFFDKFDVLNKESDGIMIQLPLPKHLNQKRILSYIPKNKDVDGLTETSLGRILKGDEEFAPATPKGIIMLLEEYKINLEGKEVTIINRSTVVGKPLAMMFLNRGATVTVCHSKTKDLLKHTKEADIVVVGVGKQNFLTQDMIKEGSIIIDVGTNKTEDGLKGDVDFDSVKNKVSFITPVPGGVGPMTVAMLLENVVNRGSKNL